MPSSKKSPKSAAPQPAPAQAKITKAQFNIGVLLRREVVTSIDAEKYGAKLTFCPQGLRVSWIDDRDHQLHAVTVPLDNIVYTTDEPTPIDKEK